MISFLVGKVIEKRKDRIVVLTPGGVGYDVFMSALQAAGYHDGQDVKLYTYLKVSETAMDLYGFDSIYAREFFSLLISVKGVGPKSAMHVLALGSISEIQSAISRSDVTYLTAVQGLGKKMAERLVVELKTKLKAGKDDVSVIDSSLAGEVIDALTGMGYTKDEAKNMVIGLDTAGKTTGQLMKEALKNAK